MGRGGSVGLGRKRGGRRGQRAGCAARSPARHLPRDHPAATGRAPDTRRMTHRGPRGGAGCSAPRHVRESLQMPAGPAPAPRPLPTPTTRVSRHPGSPQGARGGHPRGVRSPTLTHSVLHHAPRRAFRNQNGLLSGECRMGTGPRTPPTHPARNHPRGRQRPLRVPRAAPRAALHDPKRLQGPPTPR